MFNKSFKILVLIIVFFVLNFGVIAQNKNFMNLEPIKYEAAYHLEYRNDTLDKENVRKENFLLTIGNTYSIFRSQVLIALDSLTQTLYDNYANAAVPSIDLSRVGQIPRPAFTYRILKNYSSKKAMFFNDVYTTTYEYDDSTNFSWNIKDSTKQINGYKCQKAETDFCGRHYIAWFAPELPINDGPYKFKGLPGLIINIEDTKHDYAFSLISFKKNTTSGEVSLWNNPGKKVIYTTKTQYLQAKKDFGNNSIDRIAENGFTFQDPEAMKNRIRERNRHNNNPIELTEQ
jgi:GLPGLI family protein